MTDLKQLIERAHDLVKRKGFWDKERNKGELLMLIVSECSEALEAHRKDRHADLKMFDLVLALRDERNEPRAFERTFEQCIKDSMADELADIVIRIADLFGSGMIAPWKEGIEKELDRLRFKIRNIGEALLRCSYCVVLAGDGNDHVEFKHDAHIELAQAIGWIMAIAKHEGIDLDRHIELKMQYNETRERLHGKSY